tara:strand:- start:261 stop:551 length:291 start_codon:yes stop_codon:yes gene_type:complete
LLAVILLLSVVVEEVQDSLKVRVEMLVLVVELVIVIIQVFQGHKDLRQSAILLKDMQVELHTILTKEVAVVVVPVVLVLMVDLEELVMVDQDLLLL